MTMPDPLNANNDDLDLAPVSPPPVPAPQPAPQPAPDSLSDPIAESAATPPPAPSSPPPPPQTAAAPAAPAPTGEPAYSPWTEIADPEDIHANKTVAILAYILFFLPLIVAEKSRFARFHANQSIMIFIVGGGLTLFGSIGGQVLSFTLGWLPAIGGIIGLPLYLISVVAFLGSICLAFVGMVHANNGEMVALPIIGNHRIIK